MLGGELRDDDIGAAMWWRKGREGERGDGWRREVVV